MCWGNQTNLTYCSTNFRKQGGVHRCCHRCWAGETQQQSRHGNCISSSNSPDQGAGKDKGPKVEKAIAKWMTKCCLASAWSQPQVWPSYLQGQMHPSGVSSESMASLPFPRRGGVAACWHASWPSRPHGLPSSPVGLLFSSPETKQRPWDFGLTFL